MEGIYDLKIFNGIDKNTIDDLIKNFQIENYKNGEIVLFQGEDSNGKGYIIKSGKVSIIINDVEVSNLGKGEIFGEIGLLNEEERTATVKASEDLELIVIDQNSILELINSGNESINKDIMDRIEQNLSNI